MGARPRTPRRTSRPLPRRSPIQNRTPSRKAKEGTASQSKYRLWNDENRKKLVYWIRDNLDFWNKKGTTAHKIRRCIDEAGFDIEVDERSFKHTLQKLKTKYIVTKRNFFENTGAGLPEDSHFDTIEGNNFYLSH